MLTNGYVGRGTHAYGSSRSTATTITPKIGAYTLFGVASKLKRSLKHILHSSISIMKLTLAYQFTMVAGSPLHLHIVF
jgi:hypothetical protein